MSAFEQTSTPYRLVEIWQYPFKGFPGQRFPRVKVIADQLLPADRRFAVSNGNPVSHKKLNEGWLSKRHFIQLLSEPRLAELTLTYDETSDRIQLTDRTGPAISTTAYEAEQVMDRLHALLPDRFQLTHACAAFQMVAIQIHKPPGSVLEARPHWQISAKSLTHRQTTGDFV